MPALLFCLNTIIAGTGKTLVPGNDAASNTCNNLSASNTCIQFGCMYACVHYCFNKLRWLLGGIPKD